MQHKQIRPGDKDHDHDQMKPPLLFVDGNGHGGQGYGQGAQVQQQYPQGDVSGGHPGTVNQVTGYNLPPTDAHLQRGGGADGQPDQNQTEQILSLDTIGEALPEIAN